MSDRRPIGVSVVGLGIGADHARAVASTPGCRLRWLHDLDPGLAARVAADVGQGTPANGLETSLEDPTVGAVIIASYDDAHAGQVAAALRAGKHVFVEKPMCRSVDERAAILAAWTEAGDRHLASNLVLRAAPLYLWLRDAITAGEFGTVYAFDGDYLYGRLEKITGGWRGRVPDYSVMQGGGVHLVDLMTWLTAQRPAAVSAVGSRLCTRPTAFRSDDYVAATFEFASGLVGRITANFGCVHRHQHVVRVFGTEATFIHDDQGPRVHRGRDPDGGGCPVALAPRPPSRAALVPEFLRAVAEGRDPQPQARHDLAVIGACIAADRARQTGRRVEIDDR